MSNLKISLFLSIFIISVSLSGQKKMLYTGIVNYIPADREIPVFGLLNMIGGDHTSVQIGLYNHCAGSMIGYQAAFVNQGTVNVVGAQTAFFNNAKGKVTGAQVAFINNADEIEGAQIGFVNRTKVVDGVQLGFVNFADSIKSGVPIGFLFLGKGAKLSLEAGFTEMHPFQFTIRTGVDRLYFILGAAYSDNLDGYGLWGSGVGTSIPISKKTNISPEIQYFGSFSNKMDYDYTSISLNFGFALSDRIGLYVGPSYGFNIGREKSKVADNKPFASLSKGSSSAKLEQVAGFRAALRFDLSSKVSGK